MFFGVGLILFYSQKISRTFDHQTKTKVMKNLKTSVSPFLMLIIPVIFFVGLSLAFNVTKEEKEETSFSVLKLETPTIQKVSVKTLVSLF